MNIRRATSLLVAAMLIAAGVGAPASAHDYEEREPPPKQDREHQEKAKHKYPAKHAAFKVKKIVKIVDEGPPVEGAFAFAWQCDTGESGTFELEDRESTWISVRYERSRPTCTITETDDLGAARVHNTRGRGHEAELRLSKDKHKNSVTFTNKFVRPPEVVGHVTFLKEWIVSDEDVEAFGLSPDEWDVEFVVALDGVTHDDLAEPGDTWEVPAGTEIAVVDEISDAPDLPEDLPFEVTCEVHTDFGEPFTPSAKKPDGAITVTNRVICQAVELEEVRVRLLKLWFDADGSPVSAPDGDWTLTLTGPDGSTLASVDRATDADWATLTPHDDYAVAEAALPEGWREIDCDDVTLPGVGAPYLGVSGTGGPFTAEADGTHAVCNQAVVPAEVEVEAEVIEEVEVEAEVIEVEDRVVAAVEELPPTGATGAQLAIAGLLALGAGAGLVRRRD